MINAHFSVILPHVDSVKFVGRALASISLLSDSVMRLRLVEAPEEFVDCLLPRRSLYIMEDLARYDFTHEILAAEQSVFNGKRVTKSRRISFIHRVCPALPSADHAMFESFGTLSEEEIFDEEEKSLPHLPPL